MDHDRILDLIDHPPRDPERPRDASLTAQVMTRVRALPPRARADRRGWWLLGVLAAAAGLLVPVDDGAAGWSLAGDDLALALEAALAVAAAIAALALVRRHA